MSLRQMIGLAIGVLGGWLLWNGGFAVGQYITRGADLQTALLEPATILRLLAALAAVLSGVAALLQTRGGAVLAGVATALFAALTFAMIGMGADSVLWKDELFTLLAMSALFLAMAITRRESSRA